MTEDFAAALVGLRQGMQVELAGRHFYLDLAHRTTDPIGKGMFEQLANEELEHLRIVSQEYQLLAQGKSWAELNEVRANAAKAGEVPVFPEPGEPIVSLPPGATALQALEVAMDFERRGYDLYRKAATETPEVSGQAVYNYLAQQENRHFVILQKSHEYLAKQGAWYFDDQEKPIFEG